MENILEIAKTEKGNLLRFHYTKHHPQNRSLKIFKRHELNALLLLTLEKPGELCKLLGTSFYDIEQAINYPSYKHYKIAKKSGGSREIVTPENRLKHFQKILNFYLQAYYLWIKPPDVHGFVINPKYIIKQCNIVNNAISHSNKKYVLNIDLKDFFSNIKAHRVKQLFTSPAFEFNDPMATALTLLMTYQGQLPTGAPSSPVISNFICMQLDKDLKDFCIANDLSYTRYADDLTFSSNRLIQDACILSIKSIIKENDFQINEKKLRLKSSNRKQTVTGLTVNTKVNVERQFLKKTRAMLHDYTLNGLQSATKKHFKLKDEIRVEYLHKFINKLGGYINFVGQVRGNDDQIYLKLKHQLKQNTNPEAS